MAVQKNATPQPKTRKVPPTPSIIELWCLRILVLCGGHRKFVEKNGVSSDEVLEAIALGEYAEKEMDRPAFVRLLKQRHMRAEKKRYDYPETLMNNLSRILGRV
ncbi:MAG: hypothetical protein Q9M29_01155 [Mariprofundaceae bacterium]|nr:hypothetical protein [Mariprofundaceae bacterium]